MNLGLLVNDVDTEHRSAATTVIAYAAARMGHRVHMIGVGELSYRSNGRLTAVSRPAPDPAGLDQTSFLERMQGREAEREEIAVGELDVLYLRFNPVEEDAPEWEREAGLSFAQIALRQNVIVLSHPPSVGPAISKLYLEHFPEEIRPKSVITRSVDEVVRFRRDHGRAVLKPLTGYGGKDVYLIGEDDTNLKQIFEAIRRYSYVVAQEYLPAATEGDTRLFLFNARPLVVDGKYAAVRRVSQSGDFRSNMSLGARPQLPEITPRMLEIAELVRPRLVADGIFDAGLDIVGDRLVEINAISAGGLNAAGKLQGVDFGEAVIRMIERKVEHRSREGERIQNRILATLD